MGWVTSDYDRTVRVWENKEAAESYLDARDGIVPRRPGQDRALAAFQLEAMDIMQRAWLAERAGTGTARPRRWWRRRH